MWPHYVETCRLSLIIRRRPTNTTHSHCHSRPITTGVVEEWEPKMFFWWQSDIPAPQIPQAFEHGLVICIIDNFPHKYGLKLHKHTRVSLMMLENYVLKYHANIPQQDTLLMKQLCFCTIASGIACQSSS